MMSREDCVGTNSSSWVFGFAQRKWFTMTNNKIVPVTLVGKPDRLGILLDYEAGVLSLVDIGKPAVIHTVRANFKGPLCPAFGLWDGELLTHSGLEEPEGLKWSRMNRDSDDCDCLEKLRACMQRQCKRKSNVYSMSESVTEQMQLVNSTWLMLSIFLTLNNATLYYDVSFRVPEALLMHYFVCLRLFLPYVHFVLFF